MASQTYPRRAHLDLEYRDPAGLLMIVRLAAEAYGQHSALVLEPQVSGFHVSDRSETRHRFVPSMAFPGRDECGYVVGWMVACGRPKAHEMHRRRSSREVKGEHILREAAAGRANIAHLQIPGLNA